jgi:protein-S-isoprenylcysteine O-methyltransferase Ste14
VARVDKQAIPLTSLPPAAPIFTFPGRTYRRARPLRYLHFGAMAEETRVFHPNREKPASKAAKAAVVFLLLVSAGLVAIVTLGGWSVLQGAQIVSIGYVIVYCLMAYYVAQWKRGVLPLAAALAILLGVVAAIAVPGWFDRDKTGYADATLPAGFLGLLTLVVVPVQLLLIAFAMRAFGQEWNIEIEMTEDEYRQRYGGGRGGSRGYEPQPQS